MASKSVVRNNRLVFEAQEVELFVYKSYPISVSLRPGGATAPYEPRLNLRAILVEPKDLSRSGEFEDCSVIYSIWPSAAAWWEGAPFRLRHPENVLKYDSIETSLLHFPADSEIWLEGSLRPAEGYLRAPLTDKRAVGQGEARLMIRSALLLEPLRMASEASTGRRANQRGPTGFEDSPEDWHWGLVEKFEDSLDVLLNDPEIILFRQRVQESDFLSQWFKRHREISQQIRDRVGSSLEEEM